MFALNATAQYDFTISSTEGCTPFRVKYNFISSAMVDSVVDYYWDFGNGITSSLANPDSVQYDFSGVYSVTLHLTFTSGGEDWIIKSNLLTVHHTVPANFIYYDTVSYNTYVLQHDEPLDVGPVYTFTWNIEGFSDRNGPWQMVVFPDTGTYSVTLTVSDDNGCTSKVTEEIIVTEGLIIQNVFSPNGDNTNDIFMVTSHGGFPLHLRIYSRTGVLIYEASGYTVIWDGRSASGIDMKQGIYFFAIEAVSGDPTKKYTKAGTLYLYR